MNELFQKFFSLRLPSSFGEQHLADTGRLVCRVPGLLLGFRNSNTMHINGGCYFSSGSPFPWPAQSKTLFKSFWDCILRGRNLEVISKDGAASVGHVGAM